MDDDTVTQKSAEEDFLAKLRERTAESHHALEENGVSKALLSDRVSMAGYQTYLSKMFGLVKGVENDVFPLSDRIFPSLDKRRRSGLAEQDLLATGYTKDAVAGIAVKKFPVSDIADAVAIMYVFEGSTLGGRILYKHVQKHLGLTDGASFFNGYGEQTGTMWKEFIQGLTAFAVSNNIEDAVIEAAVRTFTETKDWMAA